MVLGSSPVSVTSPSDFAPASSKEFLDIQSTIECGFTLKRVRDMTRTYSHDLDTMMILETGPDIICDIPFPTESWSKYLDNDKSQRVLQTIIIALNKRFENVYAIKCKK